MRRGLNWDRRAEKLQNLRRLNLERIKMQRQVDGRPITSKAISEMLGYDDGGGYLSQVRHGKRPFDEVLARKIEKVMKLADGALDEPPPGEKLDGHAVDKIDTTKNDRDASGKASISLMDAIVGSIGKSLNSTGAKGITETQMLDLVLQVFEHSIVAGVVDDAYVKRSILRLSPGGKRK